MIKKIMSNELVRGSIALFIMFNIFNFINFVFQILMARSLGAEEYGVFAVLMSLVYFIAIPSDSIQALLSKYTSKFKSKRELGKIKFLLLKVFSRGIKLSLIIFIVLIPIIYTIFTIFLEIPFSLVMLTSTLIFAIFLLPATRGVMQGMKKFNALGINMILDASLKLVIALFLVFIGMKVYGAIIGLLIGVVFSFMISFIPLKQIMKSKKEPADTSQIYNYSSPIILMLIAIMAVQSIDILLAKLFFTAEVAGQYAVANLLGKIVFFGTFAVSKAMFPIASEEFERGNKTSKILYRSIVLLILLASVALIAYGLFPEIIVGLLFGAEYLPITNIILTMGIAFTFISLANLILFYGVSISRSISKNNFLGLIISLISFILIQIALLWFFRGSLESFSIAMMITSIVMFLGSLIIVRKK